MPHCIALKNDLLRCNRRVHGEGERCAQHEGIHQARVQEAGVQEAGKCVAYLTTHRWCQNDAEAGHTLCERHARKQREAQAAIQNAIDDTNTLNGFLNRAPVPTWQQVMDEMVDRQNPGMLRRYAIAHRFFARANRADQILPTAFHQRWEWVVGGRVGPEPVLIPVQVPAAYPVFRPHRHQQLAAIAADRQNVHTEAVSKQTNAGMEKILNVVVPKDQDTRAILTQEWLFNTPKSKRPSFNTFLTVINDIQRWFCLKTCRDTNDQLYYKVLRGTVALINKTSGEVRGELYGRLWEECLESVEMCCEGHITRLCNVFVGFDDAFAPPIPFGEILQNKMAAIAALEADEEEKRHQANAFFDEFGVPQAERVAWLEAF